jgi:hypothetical protein
MLLPVLGTTTEAIFRVSVPHLNLLWRGELPIEDLGERRLRNVAEPVRVYRLTTTDEVRV